MWYIITGGPGSGKTSLITRLKYLGYNVVDEVASAFIKRGKKAGKTAEQTRSDESKFQEEVLEEKVKIEDATSANEITFFDTAIPDSIPYHIINNLRLSEKILEASQKRRYRGIFLLDQLPFFEKNGVRIEDEKIAGEISRLIYKEYCKLGYVVVRVPVLPLEERVKFVLERL